MYYSVIRIDYESMKSKDADEASLLCFLKVWMFEITKD